MLLIMISFAGWLADANPVVIEPPQFWTAIANNPNLDDATRRISVIRLIYRHAKPDMTLGEFCRLLDNPNWLKKSDCTNWDEVTLMGWIPLRDDPANSTTFSFRVFSDMPGGGYGVIFRVSGVEFHTKSRHEVKGYSDCSYSAGETYPSEE